VPGKMAMSAWRRNYSPDVVVAFRGNLSIFGTPALHSWISVINGPPQIVAIDEILREYSG